MKKNLPQQPPVVADSVERVDADGDDDADSESGNDLTDAEVSLNEEIVDDIVNNHVAVEDTNEEDLESAIVPELKKTSVLFCIYSEIIIWIEILLLGSLFVNLFIPYLFQTSFYYSNSN